MLSYVRSFVTVGFSCFGNDNIDRCEGPWRERRETVVWHGPNRYSLRRWSNACHVADNWIFRSCRARRCRWSWSVDTDKGSTLTQLGFNPGLARRPPCPCPDTGVCSAANSPMRPRAERCETRETASWASTHCTSADRVLCISTFLLIGKASEDCTKDPSLDLVTEWIISYTNVWRRADVWQMLLSLTHGGC